MARICLRTQIQAPPEKVFDLARDVGLHEEGSADSGERAVAGVTEGLVELGSTVTWRAKHFGIAQELTVVVTDFNAPSMFADEMVKGAFRRMRHVHRFEPDGEGTLMVDEFEFQAPLGPLGSLAEWLFLTRYMRRFLVRRNAFLKAKAEAN